MYTWILGFFTVFLKNRNISSKVKRSKVTDYAALRLYCYVYWKFIRLYEHQQKNPKVPFLAIFGTFSQKSSEINRKRWNNFNFIYCNL